MKKNPSYSERVSFQNSLPRIRDIIEIAELKDIMVAIEYQIPYNNKRIDCLLFGKSNNENENIVLIELKQWSEVTSIDDRISKRIQIKNWYLYVLN